MALGGIHTYANRESLMFLDTALTWGRTEGSAHLTHCLNTGQCKEVAKRVDEQTQPKPKPEASAKSARQHAGAGLRSGFVCALARAEQRIFFISRSTFGYGL